ncbi:MAG: LacI family DNA-binding transcriptional regulator [Verrucomicrobia bacterium]|nr:LacI family DNA-binding transcriptional regulator [Verrucomicrobiota bacterium]
MADSITQRRLAELLGLSFPTVNRALNGCPGIHKRTRARVLEAAERMGYHKNIVARSLALGRTHSIGVVIGAIPHSFWTTVMQNFDWRAQQRKYYVVSSHSTESNEQVDASIRFLVDRQVDGLVMHPSHLRRDFGIFRELEQKGIPVLFLGSFLQGVHASFVGLDDIGGGRMACRHLIELGHRRIAFVAGLFGDSTADRRLAGYREALREADLPYDETLVVPAGGYCLEHGQQAALKLLELSPRPSAVVAMNDPLAFGVAQIFWTKGVRIPQDMALVGNAGMPEGVLLPSPLTTVLAPMEKMGQRAADVIIEMIENKRSEPVFEELPNEMLVRKSCGAKLESNQISPLPNG